VLPSLDWLHPRLSAPAAVLVCVLAGYLVFLQPPLGRRLYQRLSRERATDPGALTRFYQRSLAGQLLLVLLTAAALALSPDLRPRHLGLTWPAGRPGGLAAAFTGYVIVVVLIAGVRQRRRVRAGRTLPGQAGFAAMLPGTRTERRYALAVSIGAGISEELVFRGLLIAAGVALSGASPYLVAAVLVAAFGLAHLYQGTLGVISSSVIGALLTAVYLAGGSLLLPILIHITIDIRGLVLVPAPTPVPAPPPAGEDPDLSPEASPRTGS
jgi:membrane protease YdiL (CAAX protease family)